MKQSEKNERPLINPFNPMDTSQGKSTERYKKVHRFLYKSPPPVNLKSYSYVVDWQIDDDSNSSSHQQGLPHA